MVAGYLCRIRITQVPLEPIHSRLDRSKLCFLFTNLLISGVVTVIRFGGSSFQMRSWRRFAALLFLLFFLFFGGEMQRNAANHSFFRVSQFDRSRTFAVVILRKMKEDSGAECRVIPNIGRTSLVGIRQAVIMGQPRFFGSE